MLSTIPFVFPGLKPEDYAQMRGFGKPKLELLNELRMLHEGVRPLRLIRPCAAGDGVRRFSSLRKTHLLDAFRHHVRDREITVFIAASGAGSRMFQDLFFSFSGRIRDAYSSSLLELVLGSINWNRPPAKALLPFHIYPEGPRTALEEHVVEASMYSSAAKCAMLHVATAQEHSGEIAAHLLESACRCRGQAPNVALAVSVQDRSSDTIALTSNGTPARNSDGSVVTRPAGHGALLSNLERIQGDIAYLRTVDNILPDRFKPITARSKKILGAYLLETERTTHGYIKDLASGSVRPAWLGRIERFVRTVLSTPLSRHFKDLSFSAQCDALFSALNRPLRVCGVTPHTGLPGGAPFWVESPAGAAWLRIVESHEVDNQSPSQAAVWQSARYFNTVDIVCSLRDYEGRPFRLSEFMDSSSWFVFERPHLVDFVRVLERPGLWNGSMAFWNTIFVEVPKCTAAPVKRFMDLLTPWHRP